MNCEKAFGFFRRVADRFPDHLIREIAKTRLIVLCEILSGD
jgi:hypothetical protein